jgi:hypothetical protein
LLLFCWFCLIFGFILLWSVPAGLMARRLSCLGCQRYCKRSDLLQLLLIQNNTSFSPFAYLSPLLSGIADSIGCPQPSDLAVAAQPPQFYLGSTT